MGRKLDLGELTEEEEKRILDVIKRDYAVRQVESGRIGELAKVVESEEKKQQEVVKGAVQGEVPIDTLCAKCGSKFIWLINPKSQCNGCELFFCKNKIDCIVYDKVSNKCHCNACSKQRDLHSLAGDWFYSKLKGKFRRHGGAKVSRELHKKTKNATDSDSSLPPLKPPRVGLSNDRHVSSSSSISSTPLSIRRNPSDRSYDASSSFSRKSEEIKIEQNYDLEMDAVVIETASLEPAHSRLSDIQVQTDDFGTSIDDKLPAIKEELEAAISKILLPKLDELKSSHLEHQTEVDRQQKVEDAVRLAEEMIDKALERAKQKHNQRPDEENIILAKYLSDSKTELMDKVTIQLQDESAFNQSSNRSSLREAGTMTETSDSEMESICSTSGRGRSQKDVPLSERLNNLSPDSLRKALSQNSSGSSITQGVVLQKDQLVARADIDNTLEHILDEQGVRVHGGTTPQEFSTELKFTAVGGGRGKRQRFSSGEVSEDSDDESLEQPQKMLSENENWLTPELQKRPSQFGKSGNRYSSNSFMSIKTQTKSPYEDFADGDSSDSDREHVYEEQVLASVVRRSNDTVSPQALVSTKVDIVESVPTKQSRLPVHVTVDPDLIEGMWKELNSAEVKPKKVESPARPPVIEELVRAVDRGETQFQAPPDQNGVRDPAKPSVQTSYDSTSSSSYRLISPGTPSSESELSVIPEDDQEEKSDESSSDADESDTPSSVSGRWKRSSFLQPQRLSVKHEKMESPRSQLSYDDDLIVDDDDFGDRMAEVLAKRQKIENKPGQREIDVETSTNTRSSISSMSDDDQEQKDGGLPDDDAPTPTADAVDSGAHESSVALRMVNGKSLDILTNAMQKIEESRSTKSSSGSDSSKTCSVHGSAEDIHKMNEAEEAIYKNAAQTFMMEERLDQLEHASAGLNRSDPALKQILADLDTEVDKAEKQVEEIKQGGKTIDAIVKELKGAGLEVERGGFKKNSHDSPVQAKEQEISTPTRRSLLVVPQNQQPVDSPDADRQNWSRNTFTVIPGSKTSSSSSSSSRHSIRSDDSADGESPRLSKTQSVEKGEPNELQATINALLNGSLRYASPSPRKQRETSADSTNINGNNSVKEEVIISPTLKSRSRSSHSNHSSHSRDHSVDKEHNSNSKRREAALISASHSSHSSRSREHSIDSECGVDVKKPEEKQIIAPSIVTSKKSSASSHTSASTYSASQTSSSSVYSEDEELDRISYKPGLTAQELEEARISTPSPRNRKEVIEIKETVALLAAPGPVEKGPNWISGQEVSLEGTIPAKDVRKLVDQFEGRTSSSGTPSESGTEYTDSMTKKDMKTDGEDKKKTGQRIEPLMHDSLSAKSELSSDEKQDKRRSRIMKDDSWMRKDEEEENSDTESVTSSSSRVTTETTRTDKSGLFQNLTAAEQREMARIALLHLPETPIAEEQFQTRKINVVRAAQSEPKPVPVQKNLKEAFVIQQEIAPSLAPPDVKEMVEVEHESSSSSSGSSSPATPRIGLGHNRNFEGTYGTHLHAETPDSSSEMDRTKAVRGSITMRGGKMVMTSTPDAKVEFQGSRN